MGVTTALVAATLTWVGLRQVLRPPEVVLTVDGDPGVPVRCQVSIHGTWDDPDATRTEEFEAPLPIERRWPARYVMVDLYSTSSTLAARITATVHRQSESLTHTSPPPPDGFRGRVSAIAGPPAVQWTFVRWAVAILLGGVAGIGVLLWRTRRARFRDSETEPLAG